MTILPFPSRRYMPGILALLLVVAALYTLNLSRMMQYDEAYTLRQYARTPVNALLAYTLPNNHPLNSLAIWASTGLVGMSEVAVRLPAMMWSILSVALIYRIANRLEGHHVGLLAAAILATTCIFADYATNARGYSLSMLLALAITEHLLFGRHRSRYGLLLYGAAVMMVMLSNALLASAAGLWLLWQRRRDEAVALGVGATLGSMCYVPAMLMVWEPDMIFGLATPGALITELIVIMAPIQALVLLLLCALTGLLFGGNAKLRSWTLLAILTPLLLVPVQYLITGNVFFARNYLYLLPLLALCAARGAIVATKRQTGLSLAIALAVLQIPLISALSTPGRTSALLAKVRATDETILIGCCIEEPVWYYLAAAQHDRFLPGTDEFVVIVEPPNSTLAEVLTLYGVEGADCVREDGWVFEGWRCTQNGRAVTETED
jgi:4-amino-4-deoxy-L-arabinose transferase-like glycosyltransferase